MSNLETCYEHTQPNTQGEIAKRGSFGYTMEYGTLLLKEDVILLIR